MEEELRKIIDPNNECCCEYHLMAKCKEWAFDTFNCEIYTGINYGYVLDEDNNLAHESIGLESEQQYCFDACMWILDNKGNK